MPAIGNHDQPRAENIGDELTPPELAREIAADILGSRLVVVPDCGHLSTIEKPNAVNAAMTRWLSED